MNGTPEILFLIMIFMAWIAVSKTRRDMYLVFGIGIPLVALWLVLLVAGLKLLFHDNNPWGLLQLGIWYFMGIPIWEVLKDKFRKK